MTGFAAIMVMWFIYFLFFYLNIICNSFKLNYLILFLFHFWKLKCLILGMCACDFHFQPSCFYWFTRWESFPPSTRLMSNFHYGCHIPFAQILDRYRNFPSIIIKVICQIFTSIYTYIVATTLFLHFAFLWFLLCLWLKNIIYMYIYSSANFFIVVCFVVSDFLMNFIALLSLILSC